MNILNSNLLLAKQFQREQKWKKAIDHYQRYFEEMMGIAEENIFVAYAKCLRFCGQPSKAIRILKQGKEQYPQSETILVEYHNLYDTLGDWVAAKNIAKTLVRLNPNQPDYHFRLGRTYSFLLNRKKAKAAFQIGLQKKHQLSISELINKIQSGFAEDSSKVQTEYIFVDGKNNLGGFIHTYEGKKYFTKIAHFTNKITGAGREELFYKEVTEEFPILQSFTPSFIDSQQIDGILYLTIEMIEGVENPPDLSEEVVELSKKISSIGYQEIITHYPKPKYVYQFKRGRAISVVHFFTQIHEQKYNQKLFDSLKAIIKQQKYPRAASLVIQRLEGIIMDNELYKHIDQKKHYSLLHGDFAYQNLMISKIDQQPKVLDWSTFTIGPHFIDIARYFTSIRTPYSRIKTFYLEGQNLGKDLTKIEQIFFLYALILFYFQKIGRLGIETELSVDLLSALEDLEVLVFNYLEGKGEETLPEANQKELLCMLKKKELKIKQLEQRLIIVEEESKYLHKRLQNVLNSKSWKLTTPLRLFTEGLAKKD